MHYLKLFEQFGNIEEILNKYEITNYVVNKDGSVDVNQTVSLSRLNLNKIPVKFNKVDGCFYCSKNKLTTLEGCPKEVTGTFECNKNLLTNLIGGPAIIRAGSYNCANNKLTTLEGSPKHIQFNFYCNDNNLKNLQGGPLQVDMDYYCYNNKIETLEYCPDNIGGSFLSTWNNVKCLKGFKTEVKNRIDFSSNPLPDLIFQHENKIKLILKNQDEYGIWNNDGSLNEYRFNIMMEEII